MSCLSIFHLQIMDNWLRASLLLICLVQFFETGFLASAYALRPDSLQSNGNGTDLMPGREWRKDKMTCKAKQYIMKVGGSLCEQRSVKNHYCLGFCNSLYIPQYPRGNFKVCKACLPTVRTKKTIPVSCNHNGKKVIVLKEIIIIKGCKCLDVEC